MAGGGLALPSAAFELAKPVSLRLQIHRLHESAWRWPDHAEVRRLLRGLNLPMGRAKVIIDEFACTYCGMSADTIDHVPPQVARPFLLSQGLHLKYPFVEVRCCRECNSLLGAQAYWTVADRKRYIKKRLRRRYRDYLRMPEWKDSELQELGRGLHDMVLQSQVMQDLIKKRLGWVVFFVLLEGV